MKKTMVSMLFLLLWAGGCNKELGVECKKFKFKFEKTCIESSKNIEMCDTYKETYENLSNTHEKACAVGSAGLDLDALIGK